MISDIRRRAPSSGALLLAGRAEGCRSPIEGSCRDERAVEPILSEYTAWGPLPLSTLAARRAHPVVIGLLRSDRHGFRNRELARGVEEAEERAMRLMADRNRWRMVTVLRLPLPSGEIADPIEHLLAQVRDRGADAVAVSNRMYLTDLRGRDCLERVRRECFVATSCPEQLWPCTGGVAAVAPRS
ncbi:hypothetical protein [Nocardia sp. NPDC004260]